MFLIDFSSVGLRKNLHKRNRRKKMIFNKMLHLEVDLSAIVMVLTGSNGVRLELFAKCSHGSSNGERVTFCRSSLRDGFSECPTAWPNQLDRRF